MAPPVGTLLSPQQQQFVSAFSRVTGLDPNVAGAWVRNEEPLLSQNTDPTNHGRYNFLNIGITGPKNYGNTLPQWTDPTKAGEFAGQWAIGQAAVPGGFGHSSPGIQNIFKNKNATPAQQIAAIQGSGWAKGGETALPSLYQQFSGVKIPAAQQQLALAAGVPPKGSVSPAKTTTPGTGGTTFLDYLTAKMTAQGLGGQAPSLTSFLNQTGLPSTSNQSNLLGYIQKSETSVPGLANQGTGTTPVTVTAAKGTKATPTVAAAIDLAKSFLGTPYHFGGASPQSGFDCSGLVQYAYAKQGITLPRTTYEQIKVGKTVAPNALQPGDVLFFGTQSNPHHEGLYLGNGQFLEAPHTGADVRITKLADRTDLVTAKRMT